MPVIKNKVFIYLATRYATYGLQFVLSLVIAAKLGPYYLGVYGMVQLILSYFGQINFGIPHSLNVLLVHNKTDRARQNDYTLNSFALYSYLSSVIIIAAVIFAISGGLNIGEYGIGKYFHLIIAIAIFTYFNSVITTVIRFRNQINTLSIVTSILVVLNLCVVWFFEEENLVMALTVVNLVSCIITFIVGVLKGVIPPLELSRIKRNIQKEIVNKGLYLFFYNSCFYFILIAVRTIISGNYSVEEFGYFTFSYTIANAVMLLLGSIGTIAFPKAIDLLSGNDKDTINTTLYKVRMGYTLTAHLLIYCAMICFPLLVYFFPKYTPALTSMNLIAVSIIIDSNNYGYGTFLIAQNGEKISSFISSVGLVINILVGLLLVKVIGVGYQYVILSMLIAYLFIGGLTAYFSDKKIYGKTNFLQSFSHIYPAKLFIPYCVAVAISVVNIEQLVIIPLFVFLAFNYRDVLSLKTMLFKIVKNPNVMDV